MFNENPFHEWIKSLLPFIIFLLSYSPALAKTVEYKLEISRQTVNMTGKQASAMTVNGTIPGPVLRFQEGDYARIHVHNKMDVETSIHWHGLLVPPGMDGVPVISFPPIAPNTAFTYEFPIRQSGTYWYHSHTSLQEQRGVYGAFIIEPQGNQGHADREHVILLSDWTDDDPDAVLRTLRSGNEWFAVEKGSAQSIIGAARVGKLGAYYKRELQRMPAMDIADIAYDRFLANGSPKTELEAKAGETIRLRVINGSATTYFHLEFAGEPMRIIAADGIDVEPVAMKRLLIGVAETYDLLIQMPENGTYEFRATAHDGSGFASVRIGEGKNNPAPDVPKPNLYHTMDHFSWRNLFALTPAGVMGMGDRLVQSGKLDQPGMMEMHTLEGHTMGHAMGHGAGQSKRDMDHSMHSEAPTHDMHKKEKQDHSRHGMDSMDDDKSLNHPTGVSGRPYGTNFIPMAADVSSSKNIAMDGMEQRPWPPYDQLRATRPTAFDPYKPVREIRLTLDGDMERYVWLLNNKPLSESDVILIKEGEVVRFIMINRTMMHHPMHLHGHFFRVINKQGDHAPLKHTVDVAPMSTTVIEFYANEVGDWFFHCHLLYHMKSGMARMVHYDGFETPLEVAPIRPKLYKDSWYLWGEAQVLSNMTEGYAAYSNTRHTIMGEWEAGWNKVEEDEWEGLFAWDYYFNRFFTAFIGIDVLGEESDVEHTRGVLGINYLLPFLIESRYWIDVDGGGRFLFEKEFLLTPRLKLVGEAEYDTHHSKWESSGILSYMVSKSFSITGRYHSEFGWGGGLTIRY